MKRAFFVICCIIGLTACKQHTPPNSPAPSTPHVIRPTTTLEKTRPPLTFPTPSQTSINRATITLVSTFLAMDIENQIILFNHISKSMYLVSPLTGEIQFYPNLIKDCSSPFLVRGSPLLVCPDSRKIVDLNTGNIMGVNELVENGDLIGYSQDRYAFFWEQTNNRVLRYSFESRQIRDIGSLSLGRWPDGIWSSYDGNQLFSFYQDVLQPENKIFSIEGNEDFYFDLQNLQPSPASLEYAEVVLKDDWDYQQVGMACEPATFREMMGGNALVIGNLSFPQDAHVLYEPDELFVLQAWSPNAEWIAVEVVCGPMGKRFDPCIVQKENGEAICWQGWDAEHKPLAYAWSPDSRYLAVMCADQKLRILDVQGGIEEISGNWSGKDSYTYTLFWR